MRGKVLSVIKNPKGVYGFIKTGDGNYYYDTTSLQKGTFLKVGAKVEFDVIPWKGGRTKAVNVKLETIDGIESSSGVFVAKESLGNTPADRINNGALPYTNNAEFETTVELGRDQNLIIGEIAPQSKFSMMDPEQQPREGGAIQVVTDGGYQNGAVINRDAKFPAVIEQTEEKSESKDSAVQQEDMQMEKGKAPMENRSDFEESFLDAEQDVISTQDMDAGAMSDANTDGIGNE